MSISTQRGLALLGEPLGVGERCADHQQRVDASIILFEGRCRAGRSPR